MEIPTLDVEVLIEAATLIGPEVARTTRHATNRMDEARGDPRARVSGIVSQTRAPNMAEVVRK